MGTITRAFANNITTSGVFQPAAFNNTSFDNVTAVPEGAVESGSMVLISTQTASASNTVEFTSGIDSTYKEYIFILNNLHPSTDGPDIAFNGSTDGGSNYNVIKTSTCVQSTHQEDGASTQFQFNGDRDLGNSTADQLFSLQIGNDNDQSVSGYLHIFNPSDTTGVKQFFSCVNGNNNGDVTQNIFTAGYMNTTSAIDAIKFNFNSGNIDAGTIQMFGIK